MMNFLKKFLTKFKQAKSVQHLSIIHVMDEYESPWPLFDEIKTNSNVNPQLDVCATKANTKCAAFFTPQMNGLMQEWAIDFWMNPPYSEVDKWIKKAYEEHRKWNVTGTALTYAKTDTKWWHEYVIGKGAEVYFLKGRVNFLKDGVPIANKKTGHKQSAPYPSVVIVWRKK